MPHGNVARREVIEHYGAVAVLALDQANNVVMVYQYRHPVGRRRGTACGLLDLGGEAPHISAARELKEEAGLEAAEWRVLVDLVSAPGFSGEACGCTSLPGSPTSAGRTPTTRSRSSGEVVSPRRGQAYGAGRRDREFHCGSRYSGRPRRRGPVVTSTCRRPVDRQVESLRRQAGRHMTTFRPALDDQLQGYLDHLTIERGVAANTLSSYRRDLRRYAEHLTERGIDDLAKVTEADVSEFLVSLRRSDPDTNPRRCRRYSAARRWSPCGGCTASRPPRAHGGGRRAGGQAAHPEPSAAQEPDHRRGPGPARRRRRRHRGRRAADPA